MTFTDPFFLFTFLPIALLLHRLAINKADRVYPQRAALLFFFLTVYFYSSQEKWWLLPFFISIGLDFFWGNLIHNTLPPKKRLIFLWCSISQNLLILALFKIKRVGSFFGIYASDLPAGISFYTFESLSYVIDIYRRDTLPAKNLTEFLGFIAMFPRFIAGPIVRYKEMISQFGNYNGMQIEKGLSYFISGLALKVLFADSFSILTPLAFSPDASLSFLSAWIGLLAFHFQIYFDFSGYSLMAIGLGKCFGFHFPPNFQAPYKANSLQGFWRRWHITLSNWLRDYLYIPLGGNQGKTLSTYRNLMLTMLLGGIWHGATLPFLFWGFWHGLWLCLERKHPRIASFPLTLVVVLLSWVFFKSDSLTTASKILLALFGGFGWGAVPITLFQNNFPILSLCSLGIIYCYFIEGKWSFKRLEFSNSPMALNLGSLALFLVTLLILVSEQKIPFLYFQF